MNRINKLFEEKQRDILTVYYTAGYPEPNNTLEILIELEKAGADMIEIGIPFSDPLADGPTIQSSSEQALRKGMKLKYLLQQIADMRKHVELPVLLMGYLNPVMQYGMEEFCSAISNAGVDGLILPDLPLEEYQEKYADLFEKHNLSNVFLITPQTAEERIRKIDELSNGFIYMVSTSSTTGAKDDFSEEQLNYFDRIKNMELINPCQIGFGISNHKTYSIANEKANGAIIGSAFIKAISNEKSLQDSIHQFVRKIKNTH